MIYPPLKIGRNPKGKDRLPTSNFQPSIFRGYNEFCGSKPFKLKSQRYITNLNSRAYDSWNAYFTYLTIYHHYHQYIYIGSITVPIQFKSCHDFLLFVGKGPHFLSSLSGKVGAPCMLQIPLAHGNLRELPGNRSLLEINQALSLNSTDFFRFL